MCKYGIFLFFYLKLKEQLPKRKFKIYQKKHFLGPQRVWLKLFFDLDKEKTNFFDFLFIFSFLKNQRKPPGAGSKNVFFFFINFCPF